MPEVVQEAEGHVQQAPLLVVLVAEAGLGDGGHEDGPTVRGGGEPGSPIIMPQPLCSSDGSEGLLVLVVDSSLLVCFPEVRQQGHGLWAPGRGHVLLHALREVTSPGHRHDEAAEASAGEALTEEVGAQLQPHFRFEWLVLGEDPSGQGIVGGDIIQPVGLEGIRKLRHIAGHVAEQHAPAVRRLDIHMALQTSQDVRHVCTHAFLPSGLGVVQVEAPCSLWSQTVEASLRGHPLPVQEIWLLRAICSIGALSEGR